MKGRGLEIDIWAEEVVSGKIKDSERKLGKVLKRLKKGDTLIVSELSRLSRILPQVIVS